MSILTLIIALPCISFLQLILLKLKAIPPRDNLIAKGFYYLSVFVLVILLIGNVVFFISKVPFNFTSDAMSAIAILFGYVFIVYGPIWLFFTCSLLLSCQFGENKRATTKFSDSEVERPLVLSLLSWSIVLAGVLILLSAVIALVNSLRYGHGILEIIALPFIALFLIYIGDGLLKGRTKFRKLSELSLWLLLSFYVVTFVNYLPTHGAIIEMYIEMALIFFILSLSIYTLRRTDVREYFISANC